jgi:hypothetical protein
LSPLFGLSTIAHYYGLYLAAQRAAMGVVGLDPVTLPDGTIKFTATLKQKRFLLLGTSIRDGVRGPFLYQVDSKLGKEKSVSVPFAEKVGVDPKAFRLVKGAPTLAFFESAGIATELSVEAKFERSDPNSTVRLQSRRQLTWRLD